MNQYSNINFNKIELKESHLYITPNRHKKTNNLLIISHGSGGINHININIANIACNKMYDVIMIDHFSKRNISTQYWHDLNENCTFYDMSTDIQNLIQSCSYENIILLGISAGATACINASKSANKVLAICPALSFNITYDIKNVTIIAGEKDDWCPIEQAIEYKNKTNCDLIKLPCHHGYLNPKQNKFMADVMSLRKGYPKGVTLKYHHYSTNKTYKIIDSFLHESFYS